MKIGIVIPTLNRVRKLSRLISCLERQTLKDFHVYVVDSGSTDGTRQTCSSFPVPCTLIEATLDDWWSATTNLGAKKAIEDGCESILTINDDAIILDDYLEKFVNLFLKHGLRICANRIDFADEPGKVWALGSYCTYGSPFLFQLKFNGYWYDQLPREITNQEILPTMTVCGDGILIHKSVFDEIGFFEETFTPQVHGDSEFALRAHKHGIPVYVAPNIVLYNDIYNLSEDSPKKTDTRTFFQKFKDLFFNKKSDCYWRPACYITFKYCPPKFIASTLMKFFIFKFYMFLIPESLKNILPPTRRGNFILRIKAVGIRAYRILLRRLAMWVFDTNTYDKSTISHLTDDKIQKQTLNQIVTRILTY